MTKYKFVEYMCSYCGAKLTRAANTGRPDPGQCLRKGKTSNGMHKPHSWVINKKW